jgi:hypothetical protein
MLVLSGQFAAAAEPPSLLVLNLELVDSSGEVTCLLKLLVLRMTD